MRISIAALAAFLFVASTCSAQTGKLAPNKSWLSNLETAREQSRRTGKPIFVVFRCEP